MAQPQRGPVTPVNDLRNIVDRLDLLMETAANTSTAESSSDTEPSARQQIEATLTELGDRVDAVERETGELRTLVNHLMTIATWQAKVTATLVAEQEGVGEEHADDAPDANDVPEPEPDDQTTPSPTGEHHTNARAPLHDQPAPFDRAPTPKQAPNADRAPERERLPQHARFRGPDYGPQPATPSLDDDIDDILGTHREPSTDLGPPPDFGI